jgi:DNA-binding protein H-NS
MARKATNLSKISIDELCELRAQVDRHLAQRHLDLERLLSITTTPTRGKTRRGGSTKGIKVKPKYRGPKGETWAGRGLRPRWLVALVKRGHKVEEYEIGRKTAARKRTPMKKSRRKKSNQKRS